MQAKMYLAGLIAETQQRIKKEIPVDPDQLKEHGRQTTIRAVYTRLERLVRPDAEIDTPAMIELAAMHEEFVDSVNGKPGATLNLNIYALQVATYLNSCVPNI